MDFSKVYVKELLQQGRKLEAFTEAARWGELELLRRILALDIDVNARADNGATAIMYAASGGQSDVVQALVDLGADVTISDDDSSNALMYIASTENKESIELASAQILLDAGVNPCHTDNQGKTALDYAIENGKDSLAELLRSRIKVD